MLRKGPATRLASSRPSQSERGAVRTAVGLSTRACRQPGDGGGEQRVSTLSHLPAAERPAVGDGAPFAAVAAEARPRSSSSCWYGRASVKVECRTGAAPASIKNDDLRPSLCNRLACWRAWKARDALRAGGHLPASQRSDASRSGPLTASAQTFWLVHHGIAPPVQSSTALGSCHPQRTRFRRTLTVCPRLTAMTGCPLSSAPAIGTSSRNRLLSDITL